MASLSKKKSGRTEKQRSERSYLISTWKSEMAAWPIYFSSEDRQAIVRVLSTAALRQAMRAFREVLPLTLN